jgi:hypothetical protein
VVNVERSNVATKVNDEERIKRRPTEKEETGNKAETGVRLSAAEAGRRIMAGLLQIIIEKEVMSQTRLRYFTKNLSQRQIKKSLRKKTLNTRRGAVSPSGAFFSTQAGVASTQKKSHPTG